VPAQAEQHRHSRNTAAQISIDAPSTDARGVARTALQPAASPGLIAAVATGCALALLGLYLATMAPGLTWAHQGADGGELLAAAVSNGVPHPPGYPLYTVLLRGWLAAVGVFAPESSIAWRGNLLSAVAAAAAVWLTVWTLARIALPLPAGSSGRQRLLWAALAAALWGVAPLLWSQALITEVYTVHALGVALLGWAAFTPGSPARLLPGALLATAHHPTLALLLPAAFVGALYSARQDESNQGRKTQRAGAILAWMSAGLLLGALIHLRTPLAAQHAPPVNWGFADNWQGFWWLVSGAAYRDNLLAGDAAVTLARVGSWLGTLGREVAWVGLAPMLVGLATLDARAPRLRTATLLWMAAPSLYAVLYYTRDSQLYVLGASWIAMLWVAVGLESMAAWAAARAPQRSRTVPGALAGAMVLILTVATVLRWPTLSLRADREATDFVAAAAALLEPESIVVSRADAETFALWYLVWAAGEGETGAHAEAMGTLLPVNDSLYQFDWYRRLQAVREPAVPGVGTSAEALVAQNQALRPIFFAEPLDWAEEALQAQPPLWRYSPLPPP
jgi:hypothetical protein